MVLQSFFGAMLTSPPHARFPVMLVFMLSVAACFAGGGYGYAAIPSEAATPGTDGLTCRSNDVGNERQVSV